MTDPATGVLIDAAHMLTARIQRIAQAAEASDRPEYAAEFYREVAELLEGFNHLRAARIVREMEPRERE